MCFSDSLIRSQNILENLDRHNRLFDFVIYRKLSQRWIWIFALRPLEWSSPVYCSRAANELQPQTGGKYMTGWLKHKQPFSAWFQRKLILLHLWTWKMLYGEEVLISHFSHLVLELCDDVFIVDSIIQHLKRNSEDSFQHVIVSVQQRIMAVLWRSLSLLIDSVFLSLLDWSVKQQHSKYISSGFSPLWH